MYVTNLTSSFIIDVIHISCSAICEGLLYKKKTLADNFLGLPR